MDGLLDRASDAHLWVWSPYSAVPLSREDQDHKRREARDPTPYPHPLALVFSCLVFVWDLCCYGRVLEHMHSLGMHVNEGRIFKLSSLVLKCCCELRWPQLHVALPRTK